MAFLVEGEEVPLLMTERSYGRATVALTRAIQHTYIVSPLDMSGMVGMAQTLAVYHYGYYTLKAEQIHSHESAIVPSDAAAVLEWNLGVPFTSLDKPPLAIAMIVTINGERSLRRYRLVIAQKSRLRLVPEVLATFASHGRDHRLTASGFFPCSIDREYLYGYAADGYRSPLWLCASHNGCPVLVHRQRGTKVFFHQALQDRKLFVIPGIHYFDAHRLRAHLLQAQELQLHPRASNLAGPDGAGDTSKILHRMKNETPRMQRHMLKQQRKRLGVPRCPMRQTTLLRVRSLVLPTS